VKDKPYIVILAAGKGKRMRSSLPKVLHTILFRPMIHHVLDVAHQLSDHVCVVIGHGSEKVREQCKDFTGVEFFEQKEQLGTAHAVQMAISFIKDPDRDVLVLNGDVILLQPKTLQNVLNAHRERAVQCTLLTAKFDNPHGYGRIIRDQNGAVSVIREEADCSPAERQVTEVNCGIYCFKGETLLSALHKIENKNAQGEFYLTDMVEVLLKEDKKVQAVIVEDPQETIGINDRNALVQVEKIFQQRVNSQLMASGVTLRDPSTTYIDPRSEISSDVEIEGGCIIVRSRIHSNVMVEQTSRIIESTIGAHTQIRQGSYIEHSEVGESCTVGPYAHFRPETKLDSHVKVGNFVEIKKSHFGDGSKASHLSYVGDAEIGKNVNVGCGLSTSVPRREAIS